LAQIAPRVSGLTLEPRTLSNLAPSTVIDKLQVSGQSRGQTLGAVLAMGTPTELEP
jgi:hypothetical protein